MSAMKRQIHTRLVRVGRRDGQVLFDQPLAGIPLRQRIQQADETNQVFRAAVDRPVAKARPRHWLIRALAAARLMWDVEIAR